MLRGSFLRSSNAGVITRQLCLARTPTRLPILSLRHDRSFTCSDSKCKDAKKPFDPKILAEYKASYNTEFKDADFWSNPTAYIGKTIQVNGFLGERRDIAKGLSFAELYRRIDTIPVQMTSNLAECGPDIHTLFKSLKAHSAITLKATVKEKKQRPSKQAGTSSHRQVDLVVQGLSVQAAFPDDIVVSSDSRFQPAQRHLQLRFHKDLARRLRFRQKLISEVRNSLVGFLEVETPILFKSTPEGAREFLVPTRRAGYSYALPQSPQQYKQILMASGIGDYFQIARCFRDEDLRADRQPEFTQLDIELPFADGEAVMSRVEKLLKSLYASMRDLPETEPLDLKLPRMTYQQAMSEHGVDKPDLRIRSLIKRLDHILPSSLIGMMTSIQSPIIEGVKFSFSDDPSATRKFVRQFMDLPEAVPFQRNEDGPPGVFIYDPTKPLEGLQAFGFEGVESLHEIYKDDDSLEPGDLLMLQARPNLSHAGGSTTLGRLRTLLHREAIKSGLIEDDSRHHYLWVTDFPMFTPSTATPNDPGQGGTSGFSATHHPFTAPKTAEDVDLLFTSPLSAVADHYDLVLNGVELGGGSRRIHNADMQKYVMQEVLGMSEERIGDFGHLLECLRSGCPPHAGIALGLDRWVALLTGTESVRDVIAFPKAGNGEDLLVGSPTRMSKDQLETYHLKVEDKVEE